MVDGDTALTGDEERAQPKARLFVAAWPPPEVSAVLESFERRAIDAVRWTTPEQWHVTLAFIGAVPELHVEEIGAALVDATARAAIAPEAYLGPTTRRVGRGVLCVPVQGLDEFADSVRRALRSHLPDAGLDGPFHAHLTLARSRGRRTLPAALAGLPVEARWRVREVDLVRSNLHPKGARYTTLVRATVPT